MQLTSAQWVATHQHSVNSILGSYGVDRRTVRSFGDRFYNRDCWTGSLFLSFVIEGLKDGQTLKQAFKEAFKKPLPVVRPEIVIAETPKRLNHQRAMALLGGTYHEALHTLHTRRIPMDAEGAAKLESVMATSPPEMWMGLADHIHSMTNLVEDIRIERLGIKRWPNIESSLIHLQDLIIEMESDSRKKALTLNPNFVPSFTNIAFCAFRDLGLGYTSPAQDMALLTYQTASPEAWEMVTKGALAPLLQRAKELKQGEDVETQCIALEILVILHEHLANQATDTARSILQGPEGKGGSGKGSSGSKGEGGENGGEGADAGDGDEGDADGSGEEDDGEEDGDDAAVTDLREALESLLSGTDAINEAVCAFWSSSKGQGGGKKSQRAITPPHPLTTADDKWNTPTPKDPHLVSEWVRHSSASIRNLRNGIIRLVRVREENKIHHGTARGKVSSQRLVGAALDLKSGHKPVNPYYTTEMGLPVSAAFAFVIDESGSMSKNTKGVGRVAAIMADTLDKCNIPSLFVGVRSSGWGSSEGITSLTTRTGPVTYDVFKHFEESWKSPQVKGRFTQIQADGGTPLTDGVTFAMDALTERPETYRAIFVITDGMPDHSGSMLWCCNYLASLNTPLIGISIVGDDLSKCFHEQISVTEIESLTAPFLAKVRDLISARGKGKNLTIR